MSVIEGIIRGILSVFLLIIAVIFLGGLYNGLTSNHDTDVISQNSKDVERSGESESPGEKVVSSSLERAIHDLRSESDGGMTTAAETATKDKTFGRKVTGNVLEDNLNDWKDLSDYESRCEVQDPDNVEDITACDKANKILERLSSKGICMGSNSLDWITCRPNSKISRVFPGKDMQFITTKATRYGASRKFADPGGSLFRLCHGKILETIPAAFFASRDPYAYKGKCYSMSFPGGGRIQWLNEQSILVNAPFPVGTPVIFTEIIHSRLGENAIFIGADPIQYQSSIGTLETAVTFRLMMYTNLQ